MNIEIKDEEVATLKDILRLRLLYGVKNATDACAEKDFEAAGRRFRAGSFILKPGDNPKDLEAVLDEPDSD